MKRSWSLALCLGAVPLLAVFLAVSSSNAGPFDKIKKKVETKATQKTDQAIDKGVDKAAEGAEDAVTGKKDGDPGTGPGGAPKPGASAASGGKVSTISTKFDFVPGDKVLFSDDFTRDELGEFPARMRLVAGTWETVDSDGERWLRLASGDGKVRMKVPAISALPDRWTLEFDSYVAATSGWSFDLRGVTSGEAATWDAVFPQHDNAMSFTSGALHAETAYENAPLGRHHVMVMARGATLKIYIDRQRVVSIPEISTVSGPTADIEISARNANGSTPMIANLRFAEGPQPAKDLLAEGKLVTYGILFDSGSDVVKPESAPVFREITAYLNANPDVKLRITGHTDNVGAAAANLDLSKRRAAAVAKVFEKELGIAADRFAADGKGDTLPLADNAKPEGRAMNRRVEFTKM